MVNQQQLALRKQEPKGTWNGWKQEHAGTPLGFSEANVRRNEISLSGRSGEPFASRENSRETTR